MIEYEDTQQVIASLAQTVDHLIRTDGDHDTAIPSLSLHRRSTASATHCIYNLGLGVVLQGEKQVMVGDQMLTYTAGQTMLTTIDLPVISHTRTAPKHQPFLGLMLLLDIPMVTQMVSEMGQLNLKEKTQPSFGVQPVDYVLIEAISRLVNLLDEPVLLPQLAPILQQEIMIRLLTGPNGVYLRQLIKTGSVSQKIAKAVAWLKHNFVQAIRMDDLAEQVYMSPSTFRQHFREITGMSPLQYQKQLRLQEARHLMLNQHFDVGHAAGLVGYESASQFSREYSRLFGNAPQRDIQDLQLV
ncbi:AraC family transcriptional regulator [Acinetobacter sp. Tr-809]|uniref:AraC family transcriptional regulator n=1 Tax=Acinetobacter sp. Tr-809 TaxID=2608324 RepID=UPI00141E5F4C|nr:AraC family transcriptional regulator [Acinetobacter sp. Tr-809]NIE96924.1 AraC family transcriptional regulator [Acinetobacter sp. Tr-809]